MGKIIKCLILALTIGVVTACNDSDDSIDSNTLDTTTPDTGTAHTIAISYPQSNAIEDLENGFYRRHAAVMVTDQDGNAVADGTAVSLNVIDSIIARGTIAPGDIITGTTLTNALPNLGDGATSTTFPDAYVIRNFSHRFIEANDHIMLINADEEDKVRLVAAVPALANSVEATAAYVNSYPNTVYDGIDDPADPSDDDGSDETNYVIGASLLGAEISGRDASGNLTTGVSATVNGIAEFDITYPVNINTIRSGCGNPAIDTRAMPAGSADVFVVANVSDTNVTTVSNDFCFSSIAGWFFDAPSPTSISGGIVGYNAYLRDGGDKAYLPFVGVDSSVEYTTNTGGLVVTAPGGTTDSFGNFSTTITVIGGATGDAATVTFTSGSAVQTVTVTIP